MIKPCCLLLCVSGLAVVFFSAPDDFLAALIGGVFAGFGSYSAVSVLYRPLTKGRKTE